MKKRIFLLAMGLCFPLLLSAQGIAGTWEGTLDVAGNKLRIVFHIADSSGVCTATMDSPDQGLRGFPVDSVVFRSPQLSLKMPQFKAEYKGVLGAGTIVGVFSQQGHDFPLVLVPGKKEVMRRPQEPRPPYPYRSVEVEFRNPVAGNTLKGTLTIPEAPGRHPAVILLTGSGCQNRDEEILGHKPFLVLSDYLTRRGIAVLRYDDRGWNETSDERAAMAEVTMADFAEDALAAFDFLRTRPEIDPARIGMAGHSEGGSVALISADKNKEIAFVVSMAGVMTGGRKLLVTQNKAALMLAGVSEKIADDYCRVLDTLFGAILATPAERLAADREQIAAQYIAPETNIPEPLRRNLEKVIEAASNPYVRYMLSYDAAGNLAALGSRPLMAINGSKDFQVDAAMNLEAVRNARPAAEHSGDLIREFGGLNHLFQPCATGNSTEYGQIETTIAPEVLEAIGAWIGQTTKK